MFDQTNTGAIPYVTAEQMAEVDRIMVDDLGILLIQMMENAGRALAMVARDAFFDGDPRGRSVTVLVGTGGNGGGGLVCARRLHSWGARITVLMTRPDAGFTGVPGHQLSILRRLGIPLICQQPGGRGSETSEKAQSTETSGLPASDLIIDALIGYGLSGNPRGSAAALIRAANTHKAPILALDIPSGLDATTGCPGDPCIRADATLTLALPKTGLKARTASEFVGDLYLADIGVPPSAYTGASLGLDVGLIFAVGDVLRLHDSPIYDRATTIDDAA